LNARKILAIIVSLALTLSMVNLPISAWAADGEAGGGYSPTEQYVDGGYVNFDAESGTITGYTVVYSNYLVLPEKISGVPVLNITDWAFAGSSFTQITIPPSVANIGANAFGGRTDFTIKCMENSTAHTYAVSKGIAVELLGIVTDGGTGLIFDQATNTITGYTGSPVDLVIPSTILGVEVKNIGSNVFYNCDSLTSVEFPSSVENVYTNAFGYCANLTQITIGNGNMNADSAFVNSPNLTKVIFPSDVTSISSAPVFSQIVNLSTVVFPDTLISIGNSAFNYCTKITQLNLPASLETIGYNAFSYCESLTDVILPDGVTSIGNSGFSGCTNLTETIVANFPSGLSRIESSMFSGCTSFVDITIPDTVTVIGSSAFSECTNLASVTFPAGLTTIESNAFYQCGSLTSVEFPASVTNVYSNAFTYCANLTQITIGNGNMNADSAFVNSPNLTKVILPSGVTSISSAPVFSQIVNLSTVVFPDTLISIGNSAFNYCTKITQLNLPASLETIGYNAFSYCESLTDVILPDSVTSIGDSAFSGCTNLTETIFENYPSSLSKIGNSLFYGCTSFTDVIIPDTVTVIGSSAFIECTNLESVTFPAGLTTIESNAFYQCGSLASVEFPASVENVYSYAFGYCANLTQITIGNGNMNADSAFVNSPNLTKVIFPSGVTSISSAPVFSQIVNLSTVVFPDTLISIGNSAFNYCTKITQLNLPASLETIGYNAFSYCESLTDVILPDGVTSIGDSAFSGCTNLTETIFENYPSSLSKIESSMFSGCTSFTDVIIPDTVTVIGSSAFIECTNLASVTFPAGLTTIESNAFYQCGSLTSVEFPASVTNVYSNAFTYCANLTQITIGNGNMNADSAFVNSPNLTKVIFPSGVTSISSAPVFSQIVNLSKIYIPKSTTDFQNFYTPGFYGSGATIYCYNLSGAHTLAETNQIPYVLLDEVVTELETIEDIHVPYGTSVEDIQSYLPDVVNVRLDTGATLALPVTWAMVADSTYSYTGIITPEAGSHIANTENLTASINVIVDPRIIVYYTVTFIADGDVISVQEVEEGTAATAPEAPVPDGYTFTGWDKDFSNVTSDLNVNAVYEAIPVTIVSLATFDFPESVPYGATEAQINALLPLKVPFNMSNGSVAEISVTWTYEVSGQNYYFTGMTESGFAFAINATEEPAPINYYIVTFLADGDVIAEQGVEEGTAATAPTVPAKDGYTFTGWDKDFSKVTSNLTVNAVYEAIPKTIVSIADFDFPESIPYGATEAQINALLPQTVPAVMSDGTIEQQPVVWTTFSWVADGLRSFEFRGAVGSLAIIRTGSEEPAPVAYYTVTFLADGSVISTQEVEEGSAATAPEAPAKDGYTFTGWDKDFSNVTSNLTVNAVYEAIPVTIVSLATFDFPASVPYGATEAQINALLPLKVPFNMSNGSVAEISVTWTYEVSGQNYYFTGMTESGFTFTINATEEPAPITYYTVIFLADGVVIAEQEVEDGAAATAPEAPAKDGYTFDGWDTDFSNVTSNLTVNAVYTQNTKNIVSVETLSNVIVPWGTSMQSVLSNLPQMVTAYLDDETDVSLSVAWNESAEYQPYVASDYTFTGTLLLPDGGLILNPSAVTVAVVVTVEQSASELKKITLSSITAKAGETVTVSIDVESGINMALGTLLINYDRSMLTAQSYDFGEVADGTSALTNLNFTDTDGKQKIKATFIGTSNIGIGGNLMNITFKVKDSLENNTEIPILFESVVFRNEDEHILPLNAVNGGIHILNYTLGDVNNDGEIDILDAFKIMRYDVGLVELNDNEALAADVSHDGIVNILDALILQRYDLGLIDTLE